MENTSKALLEKKLEELNVILKENDMDLLTLKDIKTEPTEAPKSGTNKWVMAGCAAGGVVVGAVIGYYGSSFINGFFR